MNITFDIKNFIYNPKGLIECLRILKNNNCIVDFGSDEIQAITCRTPSMAYKYCAKFMKSGLSPEKEKIFLKNPNIGLRYLELVGRSCFINDKIQERFRKKFQKNPEVAYRWSKRWNIRLEEKEEECFIHSYFFAEIYAKEIIKGRFPERVHNMLLLSSFATKGTWDENYLKSYLLFAEKKG